MEHLGQAVDFLPALVLTNCYSDRSIWRNSLTNSKLWLRAWKKIKQGAFYTYLLVSCGELYFMHKILLSTIIVKSEFLLRWIQTEHYWTCIQFIKRNQWITTWKHSYSKYTCGKYSNNAIIMWAKAKRFCFCFYQFITMKNPQPTWRKSEERPNDCRNCLRKYSITPPTSNGSWRQGIKGEMTCTVYVALVWNIIYWIMMIITLFTE